MRTTEHMPPAHAAPPSNRPFMRNQKQVKRPRDQPWYAKTIVVSSFIGCSACFHSAQQRSEITLVRVGTKRGRKTNLNTHTPNYSLSIPRLDTNSRDLLILRICGPSPVCAACTERHALHRSHPNVARLYTEKQIGRR